MFKYTVFRIEMEFWRQRLGRYPVLALCMIPLAVLGILTCSFFTGHSAYDGYGICGGEASEAASADQVSLIRWHFYAASDSEEDQLLKIAVKEAVMAEAEELFAEAKTMEDCRRILAANLPRLYETACRALAAEAGPLTGERSAGARPAQSNVSSSQAAESRADGCQAAGASTDSPDQGQANPQQIQVYYEPRYFSARQLAEGQLSAGVYETVAFVLGEGQGANWWCLLYPPLSPGQKVVFTPVPQSRITQRAQQKFDGKHDLNPGGDQDQEPGRESDQEQNREPDREPDRGPDKVADQRSDQVPAHSSDQVSDPVSGRESAQASGPKTNGEAVREARESGHELAYGSGYGSDRQYSGERLPVQCKLKIWEVLRREK